MVQTLEHTCLQPTGSLAQLQTCVFYQLDTTAGLSSTAVPLMNTASLAGVQRLLQAVTRAQGLHSQGLLLAWQQLRPM